MEQKEVIKDSIDSGEEDNKSGAKEKGRDGRDCVYSFVFRLKLKNDEGN